MKEMTKAVNIENCFEQFNDTFSPKIVGDLNGQQVKVVRLEGDKVPWHVHENEDEMFFVVEGVLNLHEKDKIIIIRPGEFYIVPKGIEHRTVPQGHVKAILIEPERIAHTGQVKTEITKNSFDRLEL